MKGIVTGGLAVLLILIWSRPVDAQQAGGEDIGGQVEGIVRESGILAALDSLAAVSAPELERTFEHLAGALNIVASRIANDPELRLAAARAAQNLAEVAQVAIAEQSDVLQEALRTAADRIGELSVPGGAQPR